jgi:hypothetical protein
MCDWSDHLIAALENEEAGLAGAMGLHQGLSSETFEQMLGAFLRWRDTRDLRDQFATFGGPQPNSQSMDVVQHRQREDARIEVVIRVLNKTLYELFGRRNIDEDHTQQAYRVLLQPFDIDSARGDLVCVTTNYDIAGEVGLAGLGLRADTGFVQKGVGTTPVLSPGGILQRALGSSRVPLLHLHGAVGWYAEDHDVVQGPADRAFNPTLGTPVVLYPDPDKDPTRDVVVAELWTEFRQGLDQATHILVVGHSLHDKPLVTELQRAKRKVAVVVYDGGNPDAVSRERQRVRTLLPSAHVVPGKFGPDPQLSGAEYGAWRDGSSPYHAPYIVTA